MTEQTTVLRITEWDRPDTNMGDLPARPSPEVLEAESLERKWKRDYDRSREYQKNPEWARDILTEQYEVDNETPYDTRMRMFDRWDPDHIWISAGKTYDLMNWR